MKNDLLIPQFFAFYVHIADISYSLNHDMGQGFEFTQIQTVSSKGDIGVRGENLAISLSIETHKGIPK